LYNNFFYYISTPFLWEWKFRFYHLYFFDCIFQAIKFKFMRISIKH